MTLIEFRTYVEKLYFNESDEHTKEVIDDIWRKIPSVRFNIDEDTERWEDLHG